MAGTYPNHPKWFRYPYPGPGLPQFKTTAIGTLPSTCILSKWSTKKRFNIIKIPYLSNVLMICSTNDRSITSLTTNRLTYWSFKWVWVTFLIILKPPWLLKIFQCLLPRKWTRDWSRTFNYGIRYLGVQYIFWYYSRIIVVCTALKHIKVHIFWEGHKILQNLHLTFDWHYIGKK